MCDEGRLPLVAVFDTDIIVSPMNVELSEVASVLQLVHKVGDERKGVGVASSMFIEIPVILARTEFSIFLLDEEERGRLGRVGRTNLSGGKVFFKEVLGSFLFFRRKRVDFAYLRCEGFVKINLVIVGLGWGDVVSCFLGEDLGEVGVLRRERDLGFRFFGGDGKFCCHSKFGNERGVREEVFAIATEDPVDLAIIQGMLEVLVLHVVV